MNLLNNQLSYLHAFLAGAGLSFTPCVYPLIPVIIGYLGINIEVSRSKGFILSFIYVSGLAVTYSFLGLVASFLGKIFGIFINQALTHIFSGFIIILFGLSMFDLFNLSFPIFVKKEPLKNKSYFSIFFLGLTSGLIVSPCTTPVLGAILVYLATKKNIFYGLALLLSFAYGMGLILILAGTFSSLLLKLPKASKWLNYIKKIGAIILLLSGMYFIFLGIKGF